MSIDTILFPCSFAFSIVGIYLNLCYQRATHRTTVYAKFLNRNLRFTSWMHIFLAFSNILFTAAVWGSKSSRTRKSEAFFSVTLALTRALPSVSIFWIAVERLIYNRIAKIRDVPTFSHINSFRIVQLVLSVAAEIACKSIYDQNYPIVEPDEYSQNETEIENSLIKNYYFDFYHGLVLIVSAIIAFVVYKLARTSYKRAGLLGGMRNDQKVQNLRAQNHFMFHSYVPLFAVYSFDYFMQLTIKRVIPEDFDYIDILYITARSFLPIAYPISLIAFHSQLRTDYLSNFCLCRKARNVHKESKVKVIATRESQESIIANLKMIGILSDVDNVLPPPGPVSSTKRRSSSMTRNGISRDPTSVTSTGSMSKMSNASHINVTSNNSTNNSNSNGPMMFQTRNSHKNSIPSIVQ